ncbi:pupal cuticle protein Edg-78E-like [Eurosta solidaginis]|uniref:pupal cuticle protein Edg-78E-like n=1 Tax=Eurosta solidaginis TaxID=178769 RepID=UPI0035309565
MFKLLLISSALVALTYARNYPSDVDATILKSTSDVNPDGSYQYGYATSNGIQAEESGVGGLHATGSYGYYSPEGQPIQVSYTVDENGYHPVGDHLPTPPPIPDYILRSLAYTEAHPFPRVPYYGRQ